MMLSGKILFLYSLRRSCFKLVLSGLLHAAWLTSSFAQVIRTAESLQSDAAPELINPGVVVEQVAKNSDAADMGFVPGDVILSWTRAEHHGTIWSSFDMLDLEIQELPQGEVILEGVSAKASKTWHWKESSNVGVGVGGWGLSMRPNFSGPLLEIYTAALVADKTDTAPKQWKAVLQEAQNQHLPSWLLNWLWVRLAQSMAADGRGSEAEHGCQNALDLAGANSLEKIRVLRACGGMFAQREPAERYYQLAIEEFKKRDVANLSCASILIALSKIAEIRGDYGQAKDLAAQALAIQEQFASETLALVRTLNRIGVLLQGTSELDKSREYLACDFSPRAYLKH